MSKRTSIKINIMVPITLLIFVVLMVLIKEIIDIKQNQDIIAYLLDDLNKTDSVYIKLIRMNHDLIMIKQ